VTHSKIIRKVVSSVIAGALLLSGVMQSAQACTGITLTAADGTIVRARTMEFAIDIHSNMIMIPRAMHGLETRRWQRRAQVEAKYASVGTNGVGMPVLFDGVNEKGLSSGLFYFPTSAGYMPYTPSDAGKTMAHGNWVLGCWRTCQR